MTSTVLTTPRANPGRPVAVGVALRQLVAAAGQLLTALMAAPRRSERSRARPINRIQAASKLRSVAHSYLRTDPSYAADLFAAADQHEREAAN